ncbi:PH domain-containing protein [Haloferax mediterranei ATCC 33500]|uniref:PH domain-containing protein n=1 Tax=Haloferax mediterranei (strain ATCC 33500 / DSM 1411 / JCM 8866 / NBRC 14739 / NCIMB 2177 / R-4) TaxID=523841 RepID=I3R425_HALMT|nr:PH domain-containing protein [Haloferax mediterranei]AFK18985.1 hypothetical protein HFX_1272 [Haloferax mediterranei ATCC 33500]EMA03157.1 hypothetical protein C439_04145 [Haloferax mediterranei ATCC 33500]MDX5989076.1 PH domain-containing protein [Haloferax mediterranei ATCC 33500]QCQ75465.1 PH domain-containing protein [Haloferax mediterranei ATCC 33500]
MTAGEETPTPERDSASTDASDIGNANAEAIDDIDDWMARGADETIVWTGQPRIQTVIPAVFVGVGIIAGVAFIAVTVGEPLAGLLGVVGLAAPLWAYLRVANTRFVITDAALYRKTGILSRSVQRVSLEHVQNSAFSQGITGKMFDYGTVSVEVAGGGGIRFENVNDPQALRNRIESRLGRDELPGTVEQWTAVLDEVRSLRAALE